MTLQMRKGWAASTGPARRAAAVAALTCVWDLNARKLGSQSIYLSRAESSRMGSCLADLSTESTLAAHHRSLPSTHAWLGSGYGKNNVNPVQALQSLRIHLY